MPTIRQTLEEYSENTVRKSSNYVTSAALAFGRDSKANELKDKIDVAEYSAILDSGTCGPCTAMDGKEFIVGSAEYEAVTPPLFDCEGKTQCRCIWIYTPKEEDAPEQPNDGPLFE